MRQIQLPDRFREEYKSASSEERKGLQVSVSSMIQKGVAPQDVVPRLTDAGWSRDLADWYAHLTDVHRDGFELHVDPPYRAPSQSPIPWLAGGLIASLAAYGIMVTSPDAAVLALAFFAARVYCWWNGFAIWAEMKGKPSAYSWFGVFLPLVGFILLFIAPEPRRFK